MNPAVVFGLIGTGLYLAKQSSGLFGAQVNEGDVLERGKYLQAKISIRNDGRITERVQVSATISFPDVGSRETQMNYEAEPGKWYSGPIALDIQPGQTVTITFRSHEPMPEFVPGFLKIASQVSVRWKVVIVRTQQELTGSASFRLPDAGEPSITVLPIVYSQ